VGDDRIDLPGFDALDALDADGVHTLRVAVDSPEVPTELIERADLVVDGPRAVVELLARLRAAVA
jgi:trehalose 6-phosphate phosphatase